MTEAVLAHEDRAQGARDEAFLSGDECDQVIAAASPTGVQRFGRASTCHHECSHFVDVPPPAPVVRVIQRARELNDRWFHYDLDRGYALQMNTYRPGGRYGWHADYAAMFPRRKLTIVTMLDPPSAYDGGQLHVWLSPEWEPRCEQGTLVAFPSYAPHMVDALTRGMRRVLVCWLTGEPFR